jgi:hypothetical protein
MKITAFWDIALYSLVEVDRRFRGAISCLNDIMLRDMNFCVFFCC